MEEYRAMKRRMWLASALMALLWATPAKADTGVIVRTTAGLQALQALCALPTTCTIVGGLDGTLGQVFLVTTPLPLQTFLGLLPTGLTGFVDAEVDQLVSMVVGGLNVVPTPIPSTLMSDRTMVPLPGSGTTTSSVWNSYANQPASGIVQVQNAQNQFNVSGTGIVADIDTGVDPTHPALQPVLLPGFDFTRNQPGASELNDLSPTDFPVFPPPACTPATCPSPAKVNQSTAAVLDQSTAAVLDQSTAAVLDQKYGAFGHGTMVMGVIHLVAPKAQLLPLKAFHSDGTGLLSDILRAIYYAVQNSASIINMSFDTKTNSKELNNALDYAAGLKVISAASAGNDGQGPPPPFLVYPAALQNDVMGVASVGSTTLTMDTRSSFSNFGNAIVWVAAPGEAIVTTYPFNTYAAGWGTSFSAPFVSGGAALLRSHNTAIDESQAAAAVANAVPLAAPGMGNGRLDLVLALGALQPGSSSPDFGVSAAPSSATVNAGQSANFTVAAEPAGGSNQTVTWSCTGAPAAATCTVSPSSVTLDGSNPATAIVTLTTTARSMSPLFGQRRFAPPQLPWKVLSVCVAWLLVSVVFYNWRPAPRKLLWLRASAVLVFAVLCVSCGGAGTNSGPPPPGSPPPPQGTPVGAYTMTVTGSSGSLSHTTMFTLTVK
jgi:Subtilase family